MTTDRCPGCHAAVTPGAPWCTLCYTDLRAPAPIPAQPEPAAQPELQSRPSMEYAGATAAAPHAPTLLPPDPILDGPILDAPIAQAAPVARREPAGWPCSCGTVVPMADDLCGNCGRSFLPSESLPTVSLPVVGDLTTMDRGQKIIATIVISVVVTALFSALAFIGGSLL